RARAGGGGRGRSARSADRRTASAHIRPAPLASAEEADHCRADRPVDRGAVPRGEDALTGGGLRPRVLAAEERQPPARTRRREGSPRGEPGAPGRVASGALLPGGAGV